MRKWPHDLNERLTLGYAARPTDPTKPATIEFRIKAKTETVAYESKYIPREQAWVGKAGRPWNPGLVIYAHADGGFSVWDPARNYWKKKGKIDVQDQLPGFVLSNKEVWDGRKVELDDRLTTVCNGLIIDWASWIRENGATAKLMRNVLASLSPSRYGRDKLEPGSFTRISVHDVRDIPSVRTPYCASGAHPLCFRRRPPGRSAGVYVSVVVGGAQTGRSSAWRITDSPSRFTVRRGGKPSSSTLAAIDSMLVIDPGCAVAWWCENAAHYGDSFAAGPGLGGANVRSPAGCLV